MFLKLVTSLWISVYARFCVVIGHPCIVSLRESDAKGVTTEAISLYLGASCKRGDCFATTARSDIVLDDCFPSDVRFANRKLLIDLPLPV